MIYLDTSALLKLVWSEPESAALGRVLAGQDLISSTLLDVEARRSTLRVMESMLPRTDLLLDGVAKIELTPPILESASRLPDRYLRSVDAIHLASALLIRDDIDFLITYDLRLAEAAGTHGIRTMSPS